MNDASIRKTLGNIRLISPVWTGKMFVSTEATSIYKDRIVMGWRDSRPAEIHVAQVCWNYVLGCLAWGEDGVVVRVTSLDDNGTWHEEFYPVLWIGNMTHIPLGIARVLGGDGP